MTSTSFSSQGKSGRRIFPTREDSGPVNRLEFESESPQPVAELVFRKPGAESSCQVRGQLLIGGSPIRLECQLSWTLHQGVLGRLEIDLSPAWLPDQVRIRGLDDPLVWHPSVLPFRGHEASRIASVGEPLAERVGSHDRCQLHDPGQSGSI